MKFSLTNPVDMHIHLRESGILKSVLPFTSKHFSTALVMPNLKSPVLTCTQALNYKKEILDNSNNFEPIMSLYISDSLSKEELNIAKENDIKILKLYPKGATTNSSSGVSEVLNKKLLSLLDFAQNHDFILSVHGESNGFSLDREFEFLEIFKELALNFPKLKIIIEHISDHRCIEYIHKYSNLFGTITPHHMILTLDDLLGGSINIFNFCKPIVKTPKDRDAILECALSGDKKFSFGSDSAPHTIEAKRLNGAAGIFNAPILLELLVEIFDKYQKLDNLQDFISNNAINIYNLKLKHKKRINFIKEKHIIPDYIFSNEGDIAVFLAGKELIYKIESVDEIDEDN